MAGNRKPANLAGNPREVIWAAIRKVPATHSFSVADITAAAGSAPKTTRDYFKGLTAAGYLRVVREAGGEAGQPALWELAKDTGIEAPRVRLNGAAVTQGIITEQLWRGMYILKDFTFRDLIENASVEITEEAARAYCRMLLATGYLKVKRKAEPTSGRIAKYRLIRERGPRPPQIQRVKRVFDPNTGEVFAPEGNV